MKSSSNDFGNPGRGNGFNSKKRVEVKPRGWQVSKPAQGKKKPGDSDSATGPEKP